MEKDKSLTSGNVTKTLLLFALPYLLSCFLQTFYGMTDLFVVGLFHGSETTTAVSIGSQVMHMLTVMIVGLSMGTTVQIGHAIGAKDQKAAREIVGTTILFFAIVAVVLTLLLCLLAGAITTVMMTPMEAVTETKKYLFICFAGLPFVIAYNVISSIYRGAGDSKSPFLFVAIACGVNVLMDILLIGGFRLGAAGAAVATIMGQGVSVVVALFKMKKIGNGLLVSRKDVVMKKDRLHALLQVGIPISMQDGFIQIAFIVITVIANSRGLIASTSVGIVEKLISFMFLVPSAFLSAISAITAQNMGAGKPERARKSLYISLLITVSWGFACAVYCQFLPHTLVRLFTKDAVVVMAGSAYLRSYAFDCMFAAVHFCFSGYFCGDQKSVISFIHNTISILAVRIPGAYLASVYFPESLYPMGWAAPMGSLLSALICVLFFIWIRKKELQGVRSVENGSC